MVGNFFAPAIFENRLKSFGDRKNMAENFSDMTITNTNPLNPHP